MPSLRVWEAGISWSSDEVEQQQRQEQKQDQEAGGMAMAAGGWTEGVEKSARRRVDGREDCSNGGVRSGGVGGLSRV